LPESLPIFDDIGTLFGTVVYQEEGGRKKILFRMRDSTLIEMPDLAKFTEFLRRNSIPEEEISKAIRFFNEKMFGVG